MAPFQPADLLILSSACTDFFELVQRFPDPAGLEVRLDRRVGQRRPSTDPATPSDDRRLDRRARDIRDQLRTVGWAFVPGAGRAS
jgi:hypothetical protein